MGQSCFMASVAPSSPVLAVGALLKTTLGKLALIVSQAQFFDMRLIYTGSKNWGQNFLFFFFFFLLISSFPSEKIKPVCRGDSFARAEANAQRNSEQKDGRGLTV